MGVGDYELEAFDGTCPRLCECDGHRFGGKVDVAITAVFFTSIATASMKQSVVYPFATLERMLINRSSCSCNLLRHFTHLIEVIDTYMVNHPTSGSAQLLKSTIGCPAYCDLSIQFQVHVCRIYNDMVAMGDLVDKKHRIGKHWVVIN